jgi:hypothetical protein
VELLRAARETLQRSSPGRVQARHLLREVAERDVPVLGDEVLDPACALKAMYSSRS